MLKEADLNELGLPYSLDSETIHISGGLESFDIHGREFSHAVILENIRVPSGADALTFRDCAFRDITLKKIGAKTVTFVNCTITGTLYTYMGSFERISFRDCDIGELTIECAREGLNANLTSTKVNDTLLIRASAVARLELGTNASYCARLVLDRGSTLEELKVQCHVSYAKLPTLPRIRISDFGAIARLSVKSVSEKELRSMERDICRESAHSMNGSLRHFLSLLLSMYEEFEANKMFAESDVCLYMIRRVNIRIKKTARDKNKLRRAFNIAYCSLVQLVIEHCFGWGIRVINNVVTMLCMISAFAVSYFISALRTASGISPFICFETAVNRFFLGCVYDDPYQFFLYFDSLESIIGVIMLTVFTGVLVRKIIR